MPGAFPAAVSIVSRFMTAGRRPLRHRRRCRRWHPPVPSTEVQAVPHFLAAQLLRVILALDSQAPTANLFSSIQLPDAMLGGAAAGGPGTTSHGAGDSGDSSGGGGMGGGGSKKSAEQRAAAVQEKNRRAQKRFRERQVCSHGLVPDKAALWACAAPRRAARSPYQRHRHCCRPRWWLM